MDNDEIVAQLKQAQEFRRQGRDAYTQDHLKEAGKHFLTAYQIDLENQQALGDTPLVLLALAADLMGLRLSLRGTSEEEFYCRKLHTLHQLRQEKLGDTPNVLKALSSNLLRLGDIVKERGDMVKAEHCYRERQAINLRRQEILGDKHNEVLGDLAIDLERLGDLAWDQRDLDGAKCYYFVLTKHLINMSTRNFQWSAKCMCSGHRLVLLATNQPAHLPEVLPRLALLSEVFVEYLDLLPTEVFEQSKSSFANFHADYLELAMQQAPEYIPVILSALQSRKLAALVFDELKSRAENHPESAPQRRLHQVQMELRRLAIGLQVVSSDSYNDF